jgi:hypothetical protein
VIGAPSFLLPTRTGWSDSRLADTVKLVCVDRLVGEPLPRHLCRGHVRKRIGLRD